MQRWSCFRGRALDLLVLKSSGGGGCAEVLNYTGRRRSLLKIIVRFLKANAILLILSWCAPLAKAQLDLAAPNCGSNSNLTVILPNAATWRSFTPPPKGGTYNDAAYGCTVKRLTDCTSVTGNQCVPFYSENEVMNVDDTMIIVFNGRSAGSHWSIIDLNGNTIVSNANFRCPGNAGVQIPQWDRLDANVLWGTSRNNMVRCTVNKVARTISTTTTHTFREYSQGVIVPGDMDMNPNGWLAMAGQNVSGGQIEIFMFQPNTNTKAGVYDPPRCTGSINSAQPGCIHRLMTTVKDGMDIEGLPGQGNSLWEPPFSGAPVEINPSADHHAVGWEINKVNERAAYEDWDSAMPAHGGACSYKATLALYPAKSTGGCLAQLSTDSQGRGWHIGYEDRDVRPWMVFSAQGFSCAENFTSSSSYCDPSAGTWGIYVNEIVLIRVDSNVTRDGGAKVYRLALSHSREMVSYWAEPHATISWDGKYVLFGSNAAFNSVGCSIHSDCGDTYLIGPLFGDVAATASL